MCVGGTPDVPAIAERQAARAPDKSPTGGASGTGDSARRRMMFASSILTSPTGVTAGGPNTTAALKTVTGV